MCQIRRQIGLPAEDVCCSLWDAKLLSLSARMCLATSLMNKCGKLQWNLVEAGINIITGYALLRVNTEVSILFAKGPYE